MLTKITVWNDLKDELLCTEISLFELWKFKAGTREQSYSWKASPDNLNSLDGFKVDARVVSRLWCYQDSF